MTAASPLLRVLVVDDEPASCQSLAAALRMFDCRVDAASNREGALGRIRGEPYDIVFVDLMLGDDNGVELVGALLGACPDMQVIVITAFGSIDSAVQAVKAGASDFVQKPVDPSRIRSLVQRIAAERRHVSGMSAFEASGDAAGEILLASRTQAMQAAITVIRRAAIADVPVLLRGESGTGKGVLAATLHRQSGRSKHPFVTVSCPTLSNELLSSELFGHIKGSFTGAVQDQPGKVEAANGGTLFLDELGDLSPGIQAKLLRFLQDRSYERIGDNRTRHADVRIVTATNHDLEAQVRSGEFREDLLYRLNVVEVTIPPLRERPQDILDLAGHFLTSFCAAAGRPPMELSPAAEQLCLTHAWPGNIRELRNEIQRITVLWPARTIEPEAFSNRLNPNAIRAPILGGTHSLDDIENEHIRQILARSDTFEEASRILGIEPSTLWRKRRRLGI